jgi:glucosyl-3-phosphoglycerate synthase
VPNTTWEAVAVQPDAERWFKERTSRADEWPVELLRERKAGTAVSVVLPALDEEPTVGRIVACIVELAERTGLVDDVVVMDSGSADRTAAVAAAAGARVVHRDDVLPELGSHSGKGEVMWKALQATSGDLIVYVDADLEEFGAHYITGLLGPLLCADGVELVKAFYDRPLLDVSAMGGGRVTELLARPLLNLYWPELAGVVQPLAGEFAARRSLLERLPFAAGYGVDVGLLVDTAHVSGLDAIAQVDLGQRRHGHQSTAALGRMAATILHTVARRAPGPEPAAGLTQFRRVDGAIQPVDAEIPTAERPAMITVPQYAARRPADHP